MLILCPGFMFLTKSKFIHFRLTLPEQLLKINNDSLNQALPEILQA